MNRYESTKKVGILGIVGNIFLLIIKFSIALISHSEAMLADAINSAGDIFSSIMTFIGGKISHQERDDDHNFGHGKAEYIFSLLISIFMLFIASKLLVDSSLSIIKHQKFNFSIYLIIVCITTILVKLLLYLYTKKLYKSHSNILIKASMKDHRNDMILTTGTLISIILSYLGFYFFDGIFGAIISIYIMISGLGIFLESYKILMDVSLDSEEKESILKFILNHQDILSVREFNTAATGYKYILILTIDVDGTLSTFDSHKIADNLEKEIEENFKKIYKVTIHVNPV